MKRFIYLMLTLVFTATILIYSMGCKEEASEVMTEEAEAEVVAETEELYVFLTALGSLEYWNAHKAALEDFSRDYGVTTEFVSDQGFDAQKMATMFETVLQRENLKGIMTDPFWPEIYEPLIAEALDMGIPTITIDMDAPNSERLCHMGYDFYTWGTNAITILIDAIGGEGKIIISHMLTAGAEPIVKQLEAYDDVLAENPNIEVVAWVDDESDPTIATTKIGAALQANPDVDGILCGSSPGAVAAATAVREAGLTGQITIMGVDRNADTLEGIANGEIYATQAGMQYADTYNGLHYLWLYNHVPNNLISSDDEALGVSLIPTKVFGQILIITKDNVEYFESFDRY